MLENIMQLLCGPLLSALKHRNELQEMTRDCAWTLKFWYQLREIALKQRMQSILTSERRLHEIKMGWPWNLCSFSRCNFWLTFRILILGMIFEKYIIVHVHIHCSFWRWRTCFDRRLEIKYEIRRSHHLFDRTEILIGCRIRSHNLQIEWTSTPKNLFLGRERHCLSTHFVFVSRQA